MSSLVQISFHSSAFPEQARRDLLQSLRTREVNHKFLYDSVKQTQKWLTLHEAYSPARTDPDCARIYRQSFEEVAGRIKGSQVHVVGLGCGGGQKETNLLRVLKAAGHRAVYTPLDVSSAMVMVAREKALEVMQSGECFPVVCDLGTATNWSEPLQESPGKPGRRLFTFFGMLPNFEPRLAGRRLGKLAGKGDYVLVSANLAPGRNYDAGIRKVVPLYDNRLTRDWLMGFLLDVGVERKDGEIRFSIESGPENYLKRITARFHFKKARTIRVGKAKFDFIPGESIRLFFSYRHTLELVRASFAIHGLRVLDEWITRSGEEGVFLLRGS